MDDAKRARLTPSRSPVQCERRLRSVLASLLAGGSERDIADALGISVHTVHTNVKRIFRRFNVSSRAELASSLSKGRHVEFSLTIPPPTRSRKPVSDVEQTSDASPAAVIARLSVGKRLVLDGLLRGETEKEIGRRLGRGRETVHTRVKSIYRELRVSTRAELRSILLVIPSEKELVLPPSRAKPVDAGAVATFIGGRRDEIETAGTAAPRPDAG